MFCEGSLSSFPRETTHIWCRGCSIYTCRILSAGLLDLVGGSGRQGVSEVRDSKASTCSITACNMLLKGSHGDGRHQWALFVSDC